jgi:Uma2 family endonuclease
MNAIVSHNRLRYAKLRVEDFLLLNQSGAFDQYNKTELIDGKVCVMNAQFRPHAYAKTELCFALRQALEAGGFSHKVLTEVAVAMPPHDMPEPDIVVTTEPRGQGAVPVTSIALLVEVAETTRRTDLGRKATIYARHNVPEYWVVDLKKGLLHQHSQPSAKGYGEHLEIAFGKQVKSTHLRGLNTDTNCLN